jgi:hypothetical protein
MAVIFLVLLDVLFVLTELLLDLRILDGVIIADRESGLYDKAHAKELYPATAAAEALDHGDDSLGHHHTITKRAARRAKQLFEGELMVAEAMHYASMTILCIFVTEYLVKMYVLRMKFLKYKIEIFDFVVVVGALVLESTYHHTTSMSDGAGLLLVLRLWRVARIVNGNT